MRLAIGLAAIALLTACSPQSKDYPEDTRRAFLSSCVERGAEEAVCACALAGLEKDIPFAELQDIETAQKAGREHPSLAKVRAITESCRAGRKT